ncbi:MAG TPA: metallophosphoesterase [Gemmatimonadaceae bacterium]|nr:metallophosphoesterase [Gemmatimonadaceae bacterium]
MSGGQRILREHQRWVLAAVLFAATPRTPPARAPLPSVVSGFVFDDANANGTREPGERGLAGVAVSNQADVVVTDADGHFELPSPGTGVVFVSVPDGRLAVGAFWRAVPAGGSPVNFPLAPVPRPTEFTFVHASDTHMDAQSVGRTRMLRAMVDSLKPAFVIVTGDLVRDALRVPESAARPLYEMVTREYGAFTVPVHTVPGNHELFGIERHLSMVPRTHPLYALGMYRSFFGPDYYSFDAGGIHFVGLNSVDHDDLWYYGHVDSLQLAWLAKDVGRLAAGTPVVTFNHIPFASAGIGLDGFTEDPPAPTLIRIRGRNQFRHVVSNVDSVLAALGAARLEIALGGHLHVAESVLYPTSKGPLRFHQTAAVVGPAQIAGRVAPSGVMLYRVKDGRVDDGMFVPLP